MMKAAACAISAAVMVLALGAGRAQAIPFNACGSLVPGVECPVLFRSDTGQSFVLDNLGGFQIGDRVRVIGNQDPECVTACLVGCIRSNTVTACPSQPTAFKCYRATGQAPREQVALSDRFEDEIGARVLAPEMICVPVNTLGQPIEVIDNLLTCYRTYPPAKQEKFDRSDVPVVNQFGSQLLDVYNRANLLCVPPSPPPE
jgi:hypothetical protein